MKSAEMGPLGRADASTPSHARRLLAILSSLSFIFLFLCSFGLFVAYGEDTTKLGLIKRDARIFEGIVQNLLKEHFPNPFAITEEPRGSYLQGYGVVVFFQLNINRGTIRTPFGEIKDPKSTDGRGKEEQIQVVKEAMTQCLGEYGATIKQLDGHDRVAISAHVEDRNELDPARTTTVIILSAVKSDIEMLATKKITAGQFRERLQVVQY